MAGKIFHTEVFFPFFFSPGGPARGMREARREKEGRRRNKREEGVRGKGEKSVRKARRGKRKRDRIEGGGKVEKRGKGRVKKDGEGRMD